MSRLVVAAKNVDGVLDLHALLNCMSGTIDVYSETGDIQQQHLQPIDIFASLGIDGYCYAKPSVR